MRYRLYTCPRVHPRYLYNDVRKLVEEYIHCIMCMSSCVEKHLDSIDRENRGEPQPPCNTPRNHPSFAKLSQRVLTGAVESRGRCVDDNRPSGSEERVV